MDLLVGLFEAILTFIVEFFVGLGFDSIQDTIFPPEPM